MSSENKKLRDKVYSTLKNRIINLEYPPDTVLSEKDLCRELNISRSPLREAIRKLEELNLVRALPRYGTRVSPIDIDEFKHVIEVKKTLETLVGSLAALRISRGQLEEMNAIIELVSEKAIDQYTEMMNMELRFHRLIYRASGNPILEETLDNLNTRCGRLFHSRLGQEIQTSEVVQQMQAIYEALKTGDSEQAERLLTLHAEYFIEKLKDKLF